MKYLALTLHLSILAISALTAAPAHSIFKGAAADSKASANIQPGALSTFYSEDFGLGFPNGWQVIDNAGNGINWKRTTGGVANPGSGPGLEILSPFGSSSFNGYMLIDSDSAGQSVGGENSDLISSSIDCSGHSTVRMTFNELLYHLNESAKIFVSTDSISWTEVYDASASLSPGQATPNPFYVDLDISAVAANQSTVYLRFNYTGDSDYWWMIDDITLYEPIIIIDGGVFSINSPNSDCAGIGGNQVVSIDLQNSGTDTISGFAVSFNVDGGSPITETVPSSIPPSGFLTYNFLTTANVALPGPHLIGVWIDVPGDTIETNDTLYKLVYSGSFQLDVSNPYLMGFESGEDLSGWNVEDANQDNITWGIDNFLSNNGVNCLHYVSPDTTVLADDWIWSTCLSLRNNVTYHLQVAGRTLDSALTDASFEVAIASAQSADSIIQIIIPSTQPVLETQYTNFTGNYQNNQGTGTFYLGFHVTSAFKKTDLRIDDIRFEDGTSSWLSEEANPNINLYPNPSDGIVYLTGKNEKNCTIKILNVTGETVFQHHYPNLKREMINLSDQASGIYFIQVIMDDAKLSGKLLIY